nr:PAS domain S-box protein [candidate division Zixibacteria bacterium]
MTRKKNDQPGTTRKSNAIKNGGSIQPAVPIGMASEDHLPLTRLSLDRASDSIFWIGQDARLLYVNDSACKRLGYTRKELLLKRIFDIDPDFSADIWAEYWEDAKQNKVITFESRHLKKNGQFFPVEITVSYLEFNDKEYHCAYARDITARKMAESALRESEAKFRLLSEQGLLAIVIIQDGLIKFANQAVAELTGYSIDEMKAWPEDGYSVVIHPEHRLFVLDQARKKQRGDPDVINHYTTKFVIRNGDEKWVDLYSKSVKYDGRNADFVSMVDITGRKDAENVLKKARNELEFLVEERTVELTEANRQLKRRIFDLYTIFELSRNFNAVLNYETLLDSFVLTSLGQMGAAKAALYLPHQLGGETFRLERVKGSPPFPRKEILINPDSEFGRYITAYNRPVFISELSDKMPAAKDMGFMDYFDDGLVVPLIFQTKLRGVLIISAKESGQHFQDEDVEFLSILANQTAVSIENARLYESEKEALEKLQQTQRLLIQSERLAVLGELSAKIAHEVNNPLGIIKNYLNLINQQAEGNPKIDEYLSIVQQEIDRITMIVRQLLNINRPMLIKFVRTDVGKTIREVLNLMRRQLEQSSTKVTLDIPDSMPEIAAWPDGLKQVFMNLIINACDAMNQGGEIEIGIHSREHTIQINFQDTGPGIDPKHIPHIFEPFYSTKEAGVGTGLGLSVCHRIVRNHNGTIEFNNNPRGGCFKIDLPIDQEEDEYDWRI